MSTPTQPQPQPQQKKTIGLIPALAVLTTVTLCIMQATGSIQITLIAALAPILALIGIVVLLTVVAVLTAALGALLDAASKRR